MQQGPLQTQADEIRAPLPPQASPEHEPQRSGGAGGTGRRRSRALKREREPDSDFDEMDEELVGAGGGRRGRVCGLWRLGLGCSFEKHACWLCDYDEELARAAGQVGGC